MLMDWFVVTNELGGPLQADNFRLKSLFPENRSNYQYARYLFYVGQINVVQLDYSTALANLSQVRFASQHGTDGTTCHLATTVYHALFVVCVFSQAIRKAPTHAAVGFRQAVRVFYRSSIDLCLG
jgi:hypothetical protein